MDSLMNMGNQQRAALAAALAAGLSGADAAPLYQQWQDQQQQALAERQSYLQGLDQTITTAGIQGMTRDQAEMLLRSQRLAEGVPAGSPVAQQGKEILANAYPQGDLSSMPGGLSPLVSKDAAGGIDFQDVESINAQVKKMLSQGVTNLHDITFGIISAIRPSFGYQTITLPGQGPKGPDGQPTDKITQVSQMPMETQTALRAAVERAYGYYTNKMGIDTNVAPSAPQGTDQAPVPPAAPDPFANLTPTQQRVLNAVPGAVTGDPGARWTPGPVNTVPAQVQQQVVNALPGAMQGVGGGGVGAGGLVSGVGPYQVSDWLRSLALNIPNPLSGPFG